MFEEILEKYGLANHHEIITEIIPSGYNISVTLELTNNTIGSVIIASSFVLLISSFPSLSTVINAV